MKKIKFLWTLMVLPLLAACSHDDLVNTGSENGHIPEGEGFYMTVNFVPFNKGTRSYTDGNNSSNGGIEVGSSAENKVSKVLLVLATSSNKYIASAKADNLLESNNTNYQATAKIEKTKIKDFYDLDEVKTYIENNQAAGGTGNPKINVYIYCNPTEKMITDFSNLDTGDTNWTNWTYQLNANAPDAVLWNPEGFIMTNESVAEREFPASYSTWSTFSTENNAFDLSGWNNRNQTTAVDNSTGRGSISVHRMAARFDFRDGSQMTGTGGNGILGEPFTYKIMVTNVTTGEGEAQTTSEQTLVKARIQTMSLVNMMNEQYYLGRVATGTTENDWTTPYSETNTSGYKILGEEKPWYNNDKGGGDLSGNWVVTPNASLRTGTKLKESNAFATYYKYPFFYESGVVATRGFGWDIYNVSDVLGGNKDYDNTGDYCIWRYVTENTNMGGNDDQMNANSTGIVFRAKLLPGAYLETSTNYWDRFLYNTLNSPDAGGPVLFAFSNNLYCSWQQVQYAALKSAGYDNTKGNNQKLDKTATFYKMVFGNGAPGEVTIIKEDGNTKTYKETVDGTDNGPLAAQDPDSPNALHASVTHDENGVVMTDGDAWNAFRNKVVANTFAIYEKADVGSEDNPDWGYYCYYYYWNRHNDNGDPDAMGEMEFAVVRNNVYKLAVTSIKKLGHPRIPENDPDDPKPDTPDEKSDLYMTVSVQVLPWVVRVNNIEF